MPTAMDLHVCSHACTQTLCVSDLAAAAMSQVASESEESI